MANRNMTAAMLSEIAKDQVRMVHLVSIAFDGGTQYYTSHVRDLSWDGQTWSSSGEFLKISDISEDTDVKINNATVTLSGVSQASISTALSEDYTDRVLTIYRGFLDSSLALISDPVEIFSGRLDSFSLDEDPERGTSTLQWKASNHFADFDRVQGRITNDKSQQQLFSGDRFFEFASETSQSITWGRLTQDQIQEFFDSSWSSIRDGEWDSSRSLRDYGYGPTARSGVSVDEGVTIQPLPVIYGTRRASGIRVFAGISDNNPNDLYLVYAICEGEINGVNDVLLDGVSYTDPRYDFPLAGGSTVSVSTYTGTDTQAADTDLVNDITDWTTSHQGKGVAYAVVRLTYNPDVYSSVPDVQFLVEGKKVIDPRNSPETAVFSNNPALCLNDYLTNSRYGKGLSSADIGNVSAAANSCEEQANPTGSSPESLQDQFTCDAIVDTSDTLLKNVKRLLGTMRGMLPYTGGVYKIIIDEDTSSVFTFDTDNIVGGWKFSTEGIRERYNRVEASFINPNRNWKKDIGAVESSTYQTEDNGRILKLQFDMPYTTNLFRAQDQAEFVMNTSRQQLRTGFKATLDAFKVEPGDVIDITHETPGWTNKTFRVKRVTLHEDGDVSFSLSEHEPNVYTMSARDSEANAPDTNLPDAHTVTAPTGISLASGESYLVQGTDGSIISRIRATWTASTDAFGAYYELQYKKSADSTWSDSPDIRGVDAAEGFASDVEDGVNYDVRVRLVNVLGVSSRWITATGHTVVGKTSPPDDVTGFIAAQNGDVEIFQWNQASNVDLSGYEIRYGPRGNTSWEDATPLTRVTKGTNITSADVPPGDWTCYIKARDTSGNYSTNAASNDLLVVNQSTIIISQAEAPGWDGTLTNCIKTHRGILVPDSQNLASADNWETFDQFVVNPYDSFRYTIPSPFVDINFDDTVRAWANIESALGPGEVGVASPGLEFDCWESGGSGPSNIRDWSISTCTGRYFYFRIAGDTTDGVYYISDFTPKIDKKRVTQEGTSSVTVGSPQITFPDQFHNTPEVSVSAVGNTALIPVADNISTTQFSGYVFDTDGNDVGGNIKWTATGV